MAITFHIVYVPGSVRHLLPFVSSLLRWSDCSYRLVANGCTPAEIELMQAYCTTDNRLTCVQLPTDRPWIHHGVLNHLQARCEEAFFCFMDSDILAAGPFIEAITPHISANAGVFAGAPLWMRPADRIFRSQYDVICGEHDRTAAGLPLGGTFFAAYDNRVLTDFIRTTGIGFEMRGWRQLPGPLQSWCAERGLAGPRHFYDTGKALNLGLLQAGHTLTVLDSPHLYHLGGLSFIAKRNWHDEQKGLRGPWGVFYQTVRAAYVGLRRRLKNDPVNRSRQLPFGRRRRVYGPYFTALLATVAAGQPPPLLPAEEDADIRRRAQAATEHILALSHAGVIQPDGDAAR